MLLFKRSNFLLAFLLLVQIVIAQQYPSKNISTIDGLANNSIYSILKDSRGILWLGTGNGVSTIIDNTITNYTVADGLAHNNCWSIVEDKNGIIWLGSYGGGLSYFDGKSFRIINKKSGLFSNDIRRLFVFKDNLYVGTAHGLSVIDVNTKKITTIYQKSNFDKFQIMDFYEHQNEVYLGSYRDGIWKINLEKKELEFVVLNIKWLYSIFKNKNALYLSADGNNVSNIAINKFEINSLATNFIPQKSFGNTVFWQFTEDNNENLFGVADGINYPSGGIFKISNGYENYSEKFNIKSKSLWSIFFDKQFNKLYVGSLDKGLYVIDLNMNISFSRTAEIEDIVMENEKLFLVTKNNLIIKSKDKANYKVPLREFEKYALDFYQRGIDKFNVELFKPNWEKSDTKKLEFHKIKIFNDKIFISSTLGIFKVNDTCQIIDFLHFITDEFEMLSKDNIIFFQPYSNTFITKNISDKHPTKISFSIYNGSNPRNVVGTQKVNESLYLVSRTSGLYEYKDNHFVSYFENAIWNEKELNFIKKNKNNELIISNSNGEVFVIDVSKSFKILKKIDKKQLIGNTITFLETYKDYIIIGTDRGVNFYRNNTIRFIDEEQGIKHKLFTSSTIDNDFLVIGTTEGYYEINLKKLLDGPVMKPQVQIDNIEINYKPIFDNDIKWFELNKKKIELSYKENILNISYSIKNHAAPNKLLFRYKLTGLNNNEWSNWGSRKTINLPYLPAGSFSIIIEIKDHYLGVTTLQKIIDIVIHPPFWKTWWFILLVIFSISGIAFIYYKNRINKIKLQEVEKSKIQKRLTETKMEALQSQMNPHFIFNAMNSIQNYIIDNNTDDALMFMGEFSKIIRQTLNHSSQQKISLLEELQYIKSYITLENMRFKDKIDLVVSVDESIDLLDIEIPPMLVQPFIENVFVHAFDSTIKEPKLFLNFKLAESILKIEILDNGHGVSANSMNKLHTSKGIKLAKERLSLFNSSSKNTIEINSEKNKGTTVIIAIDLNV